MSNTPIVAIPGLVPGLSGKRVYDAVLGAALASPLLTVDATDLIRETGTTGSPLAGLTAALEATIDAAGFSTATVIAESWAATVALQFAAERPARVEELVLISPIGFTSPLTGQRRMPNSFSDAVRRLYSGDVKDAGQALEVLGGGSIDIPALAPQYASSGEEVRQAADVLSGWLDKGAFELVGSQHPDNVRRVRQQVSLVWGRDDLWAGLDSAFYLTRRLRNVRLRVFPGTGHLLSVENPVPLGRHIRSVLGMPLTDPSMAT